MILRLSTGKLKRRRNRAECISTATIDQFCGGTTRESLVHNMMRAILLLLLGVAGKLDYRGSIAITGLPTQSD